MLVAFLFLGILCGLLSAAMAWAAELGLLVTCLAYSFGGAGTLLLSALAQGFSPDRAGTGSD